MKPHELIGKLLTWLALFFFVSLCWVGAEHVFEGVVHTSKVDGYVAALLSCYMMREICRRD